MGGPGLPWIALRSSKQDDAHPVSSRSSLAADALSAVSRTVSLRATMKILIAMMATAMLAGPIYSQNWEVIMKNKRTNPLLAVLSGFSRRVASSNKGPFLFQNIQGFGGPQTQDVLQESHNKDTVEQNVMQSPSLRTGGYGAKALQSQTVHQQASGHYVVQNVVQGPSIHIPNFKLPDVHINHAKKCSD